VKQDDGSRSLWLRQVGTTSDIQISSQIDAGGLVFSPDGTYLYYRNFFGDLSRMHVLGGASNLLLKGVSSSISFSPDGKRFAFLREIAGTEGMQTAQARKCLLHVITPSPSIKLWRGHQMERPLLAVFGIPMLRAHI
jgi:hypothetical protein